MQALGAEPVPMAFGEVYSALQTGVIDGAENNFPSYGPDGVRHYEVAPDFTLAGPARVPEVVMISKSTWDKLSDADKALVREAALASIPVQAALWDDLSSKSEQAVIAAGSEIINVDTSEFQAAMKPVYDKYGTAYGDLVQRIIDTK